MLNSLWEKEILQGIPVCLVSVVLSTMWWPGSFQTVSRGYVLVFFNRYCSTMNLVKEKQGGLVPPGLKRWPFKLIKHFADTTRVWFKHILFVYYVHRTTYIIKTYNHKQYTNGIQKKVFRHMWTCIPYSWTLRHLLQVQRAAVLWIVVFPFYTDFFL